MNKQLIWKILFGFFAVLYLIAQLFSIMHWPFVGMIILIASTGIAVTGTIWFISKKDFSLLSILQFAFILLWALGTITQIMVGPHDRLPYQAITFGAMISWVVVQSLGYMGGSEKNSRTIKQLILDLSFIVGAIFIIIGVVFKIMRWPSAGVLLIVGMAIGSIWIVYQLFISKNTDEE
ncbi:MAG: hypothetical protein MI810_17985 [Flavobacteriales bacterium]|nr:hypothetical protein [Flavobacteriales bacterium]